MLVITASGMLFTQPLATADSSSGPHLLTGTIQIPSELRGRVGASLHYSPPCALLFTVYADGRCYALRLNDAASEVLGGFVVHGTRIDYLSSGALGAAKSAASPYSHWQDVPGQRGLLLACCRKTLMPAAVRVTPAQVELQVLKPHAKAEGLAAAPTSPRALSTAAGGASEGAAVCWVLHEDGSMQCHTCGRSSDTEGVFQQALARALAKRPPGRPPSFPVDFFERTTCVTANPEISLGGDVVHNSTPSTAKQRLSPNTDDYVSSPHKASLTLTIHNASSQQVLAGVRVLLGSAHPQHIPASFTLFGRTISTQEGQRRWYDVPFTDAEAVVGQKEVCIVFSATHTGVNVPVLDALDVYARSKADFGWEAKVEELTARYKLQLAPQAAGKGGGGGGGARADDASPGAAGDDPHRAGVVAAAARRLPRGGGARPRRRRRRADARRDAGTPAVGADRGPACAPLRSPAKVLPGSCSPGARATWRSRTRRCSATPRRASARRHRAADAPMLEGDDAADAVAPPPVTASSLTHQIAAIQRIVRKRPHNLFAFTQANPSFFGALCAAFRSVQAAAARLPRSCPPSQRPSSSSSSRAPSSRPPRPSRWRVAAAARLAAVAWARPRRTPRGRTTSSCRSCSSTAARRSVSQRARRPRRSCSPRRPPRRRSPPPTWTAAAVPAAVPAAAARAAAARAAAAAARAARAAAARAARGAGAAAPAVAAALIWSRQSP